ncbi:MAG: hypothetical protein P4M12_07150 [Gammaproteobacteria bacterium]|nr:hypothetical protein [Gammaproteobacteria bacterium]
MFSSAASSSPIKTRSDIAASVCGSDPVKFDGKYYQMLKHDDALVLDSYYACRGSARETILLNMQSAVLDGYFQDYLKTVEEEEAVTDTEESDHESENKKANVKLAKKPQDYFPSLVNYVQNLFFKNTKEIIDQKVNTIIRNYQPDQIILYRKTIPLENFLAEKAGACRHAALMTGYMLVKLFDHLNLNAEKVYRFRTDLILKNASSLYSSGSVAHAVIIYVAANGHRYMLDSTRGLSMDVTKLDVKRRVKLDSHYPLFKTSELITAIGVNYASVPCIESVARIERCENPR